MNELIDITNLPVAMSIHWMEAYGAWLRFDYIKRGGGELAEKSLSAYLQDARHLAKWFETFTQQSFVLELVTSEVVRAYFGWQESVKARPNTRNRRLANLRTMVKWGLATGQLAGDPTLRQVRARQARLPRKAKDEAEIRALETVVSEGSHLKHHSMMYAVLGARDKLMWSLFKNTTLRIEMITLLDVRDFDLTAGIFRVIAKGNVEQEFPINDELNKSVMEWLIIRPQGGEALLTDWHGQRITTGQMRRRLYQMAGKAGVSVKPHDMRHTRIENLMRTAIQEGMPQEKALSITQMLAGHADKRTTLGYLRATFNELAMVNGAV
jgi:integrase/recombinase XerC